MVHASRRVGLVPGSMDKKCRWTRRLRQPICTHTGLWPSTTEVDRGGNKEENKSQRCNENIRVAGSKMS